MTLLNGTNDGKAVDVLDVEGTLSSLMLGFVELLQKILTVLS